MADKLISSLTAATTLTVADMIVTEIATSGNSRKVTAGVAGVAVGTAFGTPATNDRIFRTDRGIEYYYDGTRWLSTQVFAVPLHAGDTLGPYSATTAGIRRGILPYAGTYDFYIETFHWASHTTSANNATNLMTVTLNKTDGSTPTSVSTPTTTGDTSGAWVVHNTAVNAVVASTFEVMEVSITETGTVTSFYFVGELLGRLVG